MYMSYLHPLIWLTFNRTIVELKPLTLLQPSVAAETFNRTIVELKHEGVIIFCSIKVPFNRTIVELKLVQYPMPQLAHKDF